MIRPRTSNRVLSALALSLAIGACASAPDREFSVKPSRYEIHHYYTEPVDRQLYELSPDGKQLATLEQLGRHANIVVTDLESGEQEYATNFGAISVTGFTWANDRRLLLYGSYEMAILSVNADGGKGRVLADMKRICAEACDEKGERLYFIEYMQAVDPLVDDPDHILVARNSVGPYALLPEVYRIHIVNGDLSPVNPGPGRAFVDRWFTDSGGNIIGGELEEKESRAILLFDAESGAWEELYRAPREELRFTPVAVSAETRQGYAITNRAGDGAARPHTALYTFDFAAGTPGDLVLEAPGTDCCEVLVSPGNGQLVSASYIDGDTMRTVYLDPHYRAHMEALGERLPARDLRITSLDRAGKRAVIMAYRNSGGRDYHLYDFDEGTLELLASSPDILKVVEGDREPAQYEVVLDPSRRGFARGGQADMPRSTVPRRPVNVSDVAGRRAVSRNR